MDAYYDITYEVPKRINSDIPDLVKRSTVHTLNTSRHELHEDGRWLFPLPHHDGVFWTNIKYACHGANQPLSLGIVAVTEDQTWVDILPSALCPATKWLDTNWAIPSLPLVEGSCGRVYITVQPQDPSTDLHHLRIKLLGFTDLYPDGSYLLLDATCQPTLLFLLFLLEDNTTHTTIQIPRPKPSTNTPHKIRRIQDY